MFVLVKLLAYFVMYVLNGTNNSFDVPCIIFGSLLERRQVKPSVGDECCVLYLSTFLHVVCQLEILPDQCVYQNIYLCLQPVFMFLACKHRVCTLTISPQAFPIPDRAAQTADGDIYVRAHCSTSSVSNDPVGSVWF
jgi:hypothetical protein